MQRRSDSSALTCALRPPSVAKIQGMWLRVQCCRGPNCWSSIDSGVQLFRGPVVGGSIVVVHFVDVQLSGVQLTWNQLLRVTWAPFSLLPGMTSRSSKSTLGRDATKDDQKKRFFVFCFVNQQKKILLAAICWVFEVDILFLSQIVKSDSTKRAPICQEGQVSFLSLP